MRLVIALGGNALLRRSEPMTADVQRKNARVAATVIAPLTTEHELVVAHGNGPQVGLLALQADAYREVEPYPLDVLGAETEGMIGYMLEQELGNASPQAVHFATLLTMVAVDPDDPAFANPTKFVGPVYKPEQAERLAQSKGWSFKQDGVYWRRVVPSPQPKRIIEIEPINRLLNEHIVVICAGGGGIPTAFRTEQDHVVLQGVEAVIDKDFASELLAEDVGADLFIMATDVDGVYMDWGTPSARMLTSITPDQLGIHGFAAGSMGPKVDAALRFVRNTGKRAAIGSLHEIGRMVAGDRGTQVMPAPLRAA